MNLCKSLLSLILLIASGWLQAAPAKTNVLFILTDNQPASIIGAYGNTDVRTPHIDQLAKEGMQFNNAFAVNGMCSPTRATLMTGLMPSQHGLHNWLDDSKLKEWPQDWSAVAEFRTLPLTLKNRGYQTAMIGKWHLGQPWEASIGYQYWVTFTDGHTVDFWNNNVIDNQKNYAVNGQHIVDFFTDKAVDYIEQYDGRKPFYLQLNYDGPYLNPPTNMGPAKNRHYQSYLGHDFKTFPRVAVNKNLVDQLSDPSTNAFMRQKRVEALLMHNDPETMANVASQNTVVDDGVGRVMAALKARGLDQNTLVIFSSDQGNFYGQHGLWQHVISTSPSNLYEAALNIPLIVRQPGSIQPDAQESALIGQYDLPTTILDYLGIDDVQFENSPGKSFAGVLRGKSGEGDTAVFYEQEESRGIRTKQYAYWKRLTGTGTAELYDVLEDPQQLHNLYGNSAYEPVVSDLDQQLTEFFETYSNPQYDLWEGGTAKGSVARPETFKKLYGEQWEPTAEVLPAFKE